MSISGSVTALRDDTVTTSRLGKHPNARRSIEPARDGGGFEDLLSNLVGEAPSMQAPRILANDLPKKTSIATGERAKLDAASDPTADSAIAQTNAPTNTNAAPQAVSASGAQAHSDQVAASPSAKEGAGKEGAAIGGQASAAISPARSSDQTGTDDMLSQLASLGVEDASQGAVLPNGNSTSGANNGTNNTTKAQANLSAPVPSQTPNANVSSSPSDEQAQSTNQTDVAQSSGSTPVNSTAQNEVTQTASKAKPVDLANVAKPAFEPTSAATVSGENAGSTSSTSGFEATGLPADPAKTAPQLTPQTIPMLAATMMRRLESGSRQFTMRLDPPELGQVEVKLTVAPDKKVRAVISADRPEALADLVRSARELVRALHEAGLELDENGMTFQMNDPSSGGRQSDARDQQRSHPSTISNLSTSETLTETDNAPAKTFPRNDPFEQWQRARISLTA